mmetsp:Transcript_32969/g.98163  ORF Transcript_32969/g.98163 Transcript_32969/m.98163 type:complete len:294 (+) Transcript_32969:452-1333(+)
MMPAPWARRSWHLRMAPASGSRSASGLPEGAPGRSGPVSARQPRLLGRSRGVRLLDMAFKVVELYEVAHVNLRRVVDYELVVVQPVLLALADVPEEGRRQRSSAGLDDLVRPVRRASPLAPRGLRPWLRGVHVLGRSAGVHLTEGNIAKHHVGGLVRAAAPAILSGLGVHVGKIDTLAEHVPRRGGLRRRDPQPLRHDADHVREPRAVPQQPPVVQLVGPAGLEAGRLPAAGQAVDGRDGVVRARGPPAALGRRLPVCRVDYLDKVAWICGLGRLAAGASALGVAEQQGELLG